MTIINSSLVVVGCIVLDISREFSLIFLLVVTTVTVFFQLRPLVQVGIVGVDRQVQVGLGYASSLKLCNNSIWFMGTGASKLTELPEFGDAVKRCNRPSSSIPLRFLLAHPGNEYITAAARRAGERDQRVYSDKIIRSLDIIRELRNNLDLNLEVRFFIPDRKDDFPWFRMMFLDDRLCLVSYNVYGKGNGRQLPQLHIRRLEDGDETRGFYYVFHQYFEREWAKALPWDFTSSYPTKRARR
ncbi:MAG: hypothetical protein HC888_09640 [Candidatus Competibacteraceae bacterium]|nr:hypothetical protein [Candidatus Competibacteraceae bacterium]